MADIPRAFVCGHPVAHSRSPLIHNHWLQAYGIAGAYEAVDVPPEQFADFVAAAPGRGFVGGNVTIPHKEEAFALADRKDEAALKIGAVNTLWFEQGRLCATNTDWEGFLANLDAQAPGWQSDGPSVILGAGGAARAVIYALRQRRVPEIRIVNRTAARAERLTGDFDGGVSAHPWEELPNVSKDCSLLVNATPLGMSATGSGVPDISTLPDHAVVNDLVYAPLVTPLLRRAAARGLKTVDGLGMLLYQAVAGFEHWFGKRPEVTPALRAMVVADMERRA
jgi:shikimate dehydrogenase